MDVEIMQSARRARRQGHSMWTRAQYEGYRNWLSLMSHSDSEPYETDGAK